MAIFERVFYNHSLALLGELHLLDRIPSRLQACGQGARIVSSVPGVMGNIVDCGAGAPGHKPRPRRPGASEYLVRRTRPTEQPRIGLGPLPFSCAREKCRRRSRQKPRSLTCPGARRHPDHFGDFEMAAYQRSIFRSRFDWNDSHWFRRLATRSLRFDGIKLFFFQIIRA